MNVLAQSQAGVGPISIDREYAGYPYRESSELSSLPVLPTIIGSCYYVFMSESSAPEISMEDRVQRQHVFDAEIQPTLTGTSYQGRLWAVASNLLGESATFATGERHFSGQFYQWEAPKPEAVPGLVDSLGELVSTMEQSSSDDPEMGYKLAGLTYVLTRLVQPFPDMNKQIARLISSSYLKEMVEEAREFNFPTPDRAHTTGTFEEIMSPKDFVAYLPTGEAISNVVDAIYPANYNNDVVRSVLTTLLDDFSRSGKSGEDSLSFRQVDDLCAELGGDINDHSGVSQKRGTHIYNNAIKELLTLQTSRFIEVVVKEGLDGDCPESRLLRAFVQKYEDTLPDILEHQDVREQQKDN